MSEPRPVSPSVAHPRPPAAPAPAPTARVSSAQLFAGARELLIDHDGAVYRLKQTALGKLILTK